jgi:hypothetical protein
VISLKVEISVNGAMRAPSRPDEHPVDDISAARRFRTDGPLI